MLGKFLRLSAPVLIIQLSISIPLAATTIEWPSRSGIIWNVSDGTGTGPMGCNLSGSNVWKDSRGYLHLRITRKHVASTRSYNWYGAQLQTDQCFHYGTYQWQVSTNVTRLDKNIVFGMFNYPAFPCAIGPDQTNEIDIEMARWGKAKAPQGNFTVWPEIPPYYGANWTSRFKMPASQMATHQFIWKPKSVQFTSFNGYVTNTKSVISRVPFEPVDPSSIPQSPIPVVINLWLYKGVPPVRQSAKYEVVLKSFTYQPCTFTLASTSMSFDPSGGSGSFDVMASAANCAWAAASDSTWIHTNSSGTGNGTVTYTVDAYTGAGARSGTISVGGETYTVTQGNGCAYSLSSYSNNFTPSAGVGTFTVAASSPGCEWTTSNDSPGWITGVTGFGTGTGAVSYNVAVNDTTATRKGHITVQGNTHTVTQAAGCSYSLTRSSWNFTKSGGAGTFTVSTQGGCAWKTTNDSPSWITNVTASGTGTGDVGYTVAASTAGMARTGHIWVQDQMYTVTQNDGCTYNLSSESQNFAQPGGTGTFTVNTQTGCAWTTTNDSPSWIKNVTASGTDTGDVVYTVLANDTISARTGHITVQGRMHTVTQDCCPYSLSHYSWHFDNSGGNGAFSVTTMDGCAWTASSDAAWIRVDTPSGTGSEIVYYFVSANTLGTARTGHITVKGQVHTVTQDDGCTYSFYPGNTKNWPASGVTDTSFVLQTQAGCSWSTVNDSPSWITNVTASGRSSYNVFYTVTPNTGPARTGHITIDDQVYTITQDSGCTYTVSGLTTALTKFFNCPETAASFTVTTDSSCPWTISTSSPDWIILPSQLTMKGNGTVSYAVNLNNSNQDRSGTITVQGTVYYLYQYARFCQPRYLAVPHIVYDHLLNLMWTQYPITGTGKVDWNDASNAINDMNHDKVHGHEDWRMPTIAELQSIYDTKLTTCILVHCSDTSPDWCCSYPVPPFEPGGIWPFVWSSETAGADSAYFFDFAFPSRVVWADRDVNLGTGIAVCRVTSFNCD